jgi:D-lactate dehydrogenase (cytochrome)
MSDAAIGFLTTLLGPDRVITAASALAGFAADVADGPAAVPCLAARPGSVDDLARAVKLLTDLGVAVVPRGGSSGGGGTEIVRAPAAILDLRDLDRIVEINEADRYVTVEAGCTWSALWDALRPRGLRTPFFGPLSGAAATVGGTASANAWFFGSGSYGTMSDTVLGLDVVLADGSLVETGAAAGEGRSPFMRHFGPDFTGLFLGDCGAFGVKARVTLPLIPAPAAEGYASFAFERFEDIAEAHVALAREHVVAEQWGLDPNGNDALAARGFKFLEGVTFAHDPAPEYVARLNLRLVDGHRSTLRGGYSLHVVVEGASDRDVEARLGRVRRLMVPMALKELPNAIPQLARARPFRAVEDIFAAGGESWLTVHGLFPLSMAGTVVAVTDEYFLRHRAEMERHAVRAACVTGTAGTAFLLEPMFTWAGETADARALALRLRRDLIGLWGTFGASHLQIGRTYPYAGALSSAARAMADAVKRALDPRDLMNPGVLQLGVGAPPKVSRKFAEFPQNLLEDRERR